MNGMNPSKLWTVPRRGIEYLPLREGKGGRITRQHGDFFRTARFGGFHKEDVMRYIEDLERRVHAQSQDAKAAQTQLRETRRSLLRWMAAARLERRRGETAREVRRELSVFEERLAAAQALAEEIERENHFLRQRIRVLEEDPKVEPPSVPLEQLTFQLFLDELDEMEGET